MWQDNSFTSLISACQSFPQLFHVTLISQCLSLILSLQEQIYIIDILSKLCKAYKIWVLSKIKFWGYLRSFWVFFLTQHEPLAMALLYLSISSRVMVLFFNSWGHSFYLNNIPLFLPKLYFLLTMNMNGRNRR